MLYKFKLWFDKYYRWIMGAVALLTVALFFVPIMADCRYGDPSLFSLASRVVYYFKETNLIIEPTVWLVCTIAFAIAFLLVLASILKSKYLWLPLVGYCIIISAFIAIMVTNEVLFHQNPYVEPLMSSFASPHIAFFIAALLILFFGLMMFLNKYYKTHTPPTIVKKPKRLTRAQRIAQLEHQVRELQEKTED